MIEVSIRIATAAVVRMQRAALYLTALALFAGRSTYGLCRYRRSLIVMQQMSNLPTDILRRLGTRATRLACPRNKQRTSHNNAGFGCVVETRYFSAWVDLIRRIICDVCIEVYVVLIPNRIGLTEPSQVWDVASRPVVIEASLAVEVHSDIAE